MRGFLIFNYLFYAKMTALGPKYEPQNNQDHQVIEFSDSSQLILI